jgi:hypothetical protein
MDTGTREFKRIPRRFRFTFGVDAVAGCGCTPLASNPEILRDSVVLKMRQS